MFCGQRREKTAVRGHAKVCDCVFAFVWVCLLAEQVASKDMMGPLSDDTDGELEGWRRMLYAYNNSWSLPVPPALLRLHMSGVRDGVAPKCCLKIRTQIGFNRCDDFHKHHQFCETMYNRGRTKAKFITHILKTYADPLFRVFVYPQFLAN